MAVCDDLQNASITKTFEKNAPGCNTIPEVEASCALIISENDLQNTIAIYPNPVLDVVIINSTSSIDFLKIPLYTINDQKLVEFSTKQLDVSRLSSGVYFVQITTNLGTITKKIVKE
ncbi:T9SS type A sorting domain-containing protein [Patiriisocius sp. Uisw_017]|jgi:hypothetical protein|uniref:T9SS type A sorting domain-containing protein n=1 Tax=Patiriisocius sp. Uisw_017 TaxID=3230968 RepID=UPI0039E76955